MHARQQTCTHTHKGQVNCSEPRLDVSADICMYPELSESLVNAAVSSKERQRASEDIQFT
jgi:hypothetical protein